MTAELGRTKKGSIELITFICVECGNDGHFSKKNAAPEFLLKQHKVCYWCEQENVKEEYHA